MLLGEEHDLRNRIMHVDWGKVDGETTPQSAKHEDRKVDGETTPQSAKHEDKSAKTGDGLPPKCKNC